MAIDDLPKGDSSWFTHDRFGLFIHWGLYSLAARHEWVKKREAITDGDYEKYFKHFDPDLYNPTEWARLAKRAGMKYFVITTKHHEGFCLWDTAHTDYKAPNAPAGRDLLRPMVEAFRAEGIRVGFYYSLLDWHHPDYTVDNKHPMANDEDERAKNKQRDMSVYAEYMRKQVRELLTDFGQIDLLWFDFTFRGEDGKGPDDWESEALLRVVRELQPDIMVNNRLGVMGGGDFVTPEQFQPKNAPKDEFGNLAVWEGCHTFSGSWGYHRDEQTWKSVPQLLGMLVDGVSKGGNLLLNVGPTARGEFDYRARERLEAIGDWMHHHSRAIYGCGWAPDDLQAPPDCRYTYNEKTNRLYLHFLAWPFKHVYCPGLEGRVEYAQLLHDASEIKHDIKGGARQEGDTSRADGGTLRFHLPVVKPNVEVPVIEIFLK